MLREMYCVKDNLIGYNNPYPQINRAVALRTAKFTAEQSETAEVKDKDLYFVGVWDDQTGVFQQPATPEFVVSLEQLKEAQTNG